MRPALLAAMLSSMGQRAVAIGVDVGGTKTLCVLVDERWQIIAREKFRTAPEGRKEFIQELLHTTRALLTVARRRKLPVIGAGVAWAGKVNERRTVVESSPNLLCLEKLNIGQLFKQRLKLNACLGNDVQLALYAEHQLGVARRCRNVLGVFFGTGVGGAVIIDGKLYCGANGIGGQIGALLTPSAVDPDAVDSHGILDRMVSKSAIAGAALAFAAKQWAPNLFKKVGTDLAEVTWGTLKDAIRAGDRRVEKLLRARLRIAGTALSNVVNFLNPEMLVLGGGLTEEMPQLVRAELESALRTYLVPEVSRALKVRVAQFKNNAAALGAARWAFENFRDDSNQV